MAGIDGISVPTIGDTPAQYSEKFSDSITAIDDHDHSSGNGDAVKELHLDATDNSSLEVIAGVVRVKDGGITSAKVSPSMGGLVLTGICLPMGYNVSSPPTGFLLCDGSAVSRATYATLFGVIGTAFGNGDGSTTFNVPDMRGRFARGFSSASSTYDLDRTSRTASGTGGATGNNLGSYQADQYVNHNHNAPTAGNQTNLKWNNPPGGDGTRHQNNGGSSKGSSSTTSVDNFGSGDTRPKNVYVDWIIKT